MSQRLNLVIYLTQLCFKFKLLLLFKRSDFGDLRFVILDLCVENSALTLLGQFAFSTGSFQRYDLLSGL